MKIYINNLNIDLLPNIMTLIKDQYVDAENYILLYTTDGIYQINNNDIKKINTVDCDIKMHPNYYENYTLIIDPSYYTMETVNKIPLEHISKNIKRSFFKLNKQSTITLVVEGDVIEENVKPSDMYFEVDNNININDPFIKKEISVFLSLLN